MRTFSKLLIASFLVTGFFSCKKDGGSSSASILGTWTFVSERVKIYESGSLTFDSTYTDPEVEFETLRFDNNNTAFVVDADNSSSTFTYTYDAGNKLLVTDESAFTVQTLTSSSLVLYSADPDNSSANRTEVTITSKR